MSSDATANNETASDTSPEQNPSGTGGPTFLDQMGKMALAQQSRAMMDLELDRCLLRRDMKARQNERYGLPQEDLPDCSGDDMEVRIGDDTKTDNSKVIHNHYHGTDPCQPQPQPCPPAVRPRFPWWLIAALVLPWIALAVLLIAWILNNWDDGGGNSNPPVIWQLDIGAENPEIPSSPSIQPVPQEIEQ